MLVLVLGLAVFTTAAFALRTVNTFDIAARQLQSATDYRAYQQGEDSLGNADLWDRKRVEFADTLVATVYVAGRPGALASTVPDSLRQFAEQWRRRTHKQLATTRLEFLASLGIGASALLLAWCVTWWWFSARAQRPESSTSS